MLKQHPVYRRSSIHLSVCLSLAGLSDFDGIRYGVFKKIVSPRYSFVQTAAQPVALCYGCKSSSANTTAEKPHDILKVATRTTSFAGLLRHRDSDICPELADGPILHVTCLSTNGLSLRL